MKPASSSGFALIPPTVLAVCSLLLWSPTLGFFFFADDLYCLTYLYRIFNGEPALALTRLASSWMDRDVLLLYRPFADITLFFDYFFWRTNSAGYHLTNIVINAIAAVFVYLIGIELLAPRRESEIARRSDWQAMTLAFLASLLFIVTPLHVEPVCWIVGRLDLLCAALYLSSFWCAIRWVRFDSRGYFAGAVLLYLLAVLSKEAAITLPFVLIIWSLTMAPTVFRRVARLSGLLFGLTFVYVVIRALLLGTIIGGYQGTFGHYFRKSYAIRLNAGSFKLFLIPLNRELWQQGGSLEMFFRGLYILAGALLFWRIPFCPWSLERVRLLAFLALFLLVTFLPALPAFHLTDTLVGSRMLYLTTAPLALLASAALLPLVEHRNWRARRVLPIGIALILAFSVVCASVTVRDFASWKYAGEALKAMRRQVILAIKNNPGTKILIANIPTNYQGAHMCYEISEIKTLMGPAFGADHSKDLVFLEWWPSDLSTNLQRLKSMLADPSIRVLKFDLNNMRLGPCPPLFRQEKRLPNGRMTLPGMNLSLYRQSERSFLIDMQPWEAHSSVELMKLDIVATGTGQSAGLKMTVIENGQESPEALWTPVYTDGKPHSYTLPVSAQKPWLLADGKAHLLLELEDGKLDILKVEPIAFGNSPQLFFDPQSIHEPADGIAYLRNGKEGLLLAGTSTDTEFLMFEVSKPSYKFDFPGDMQRDPVASDYVQKRLVLRPIRPGQFAMKITRADFPRPARYQIRACAMTADGKLLGYFSDPLTIAVE